MPKVRQDADLSKQLTDLLKEVYNDSIIKKLVYKAPNLISMIDVPVSCPCSHTKGDQQRVEQLMGTWQKCTCGAMKRKKGKKK